MGGEGGVAVGRGLEFVIRADPRLRLVSCGLARAARAEQELSTFATYRPAAFPRPRDRTFKYLTQILRAGL